MKNLYRCFLVAANLIISLAISGIAGGCGEQFDLDQLPVATAKGAVGDTVYVLQSPVWVGFNKPQDVHIGYDFLLYVADTDNGRIVMMDLAGNVLGYSQPIRHPVAITQDHRFNLIIACEFDTVVGGQLLTLGAIAKLRLLDVHHNIAAAPVEIVYHEPVNKPARRYTGVAALYDNSYYATRMGPDNTSPVDPDQGVIHFGKNDVPYPRDLIDLSPVLKIGGTGLTVLDSPSGITTFNDRRYLTDFILTQIGSQSLYKVQWLTFKPGSDFSIPSWESRFSQITDAGKTIVTDNFFSQPEDVTLDERGNIYVIDAGLDSLVKMNSQGQILRESFGPFKSGRSLNHPMGVAYFDRTLYIADTGNNRILRYRLSTDTR